MRSVRFILPKTSGNSFRLQIDELPYFYDSVHYHPEHQITLIRSGSGSCFIGNYVGRFEKGNLFLIGRNVPHVFRSDDLYYAPENVLISSGISVYFKDETFGPQFFSIPEMVHIRRLLDLASRGILFPGEDGEKAAGMLKVLGDLQPFDRMQMLLSLLNLLAGSEQSRPLSSVPFDMPVDDSQHERINAVFAYLSANFRRDISLSVISSVANLTPNAFCRYFRRRTGKTFSGFLNAVRVEYAGKLIAGSHQGMGSVAMQSGFNSISYFNRQFKRITGLTPQEYRKRFGRDLR